MQGRKIMINKGGKIIINKGGKIHNEETSDL
jgi:hypothetical protein